MAGCTTSNDCCLIYRGKVYIAKRSDCCPAFKEDERQFIGNVTELSIDQSINKITQKDYTNPAGGNYCTSFEIEEANLAMTVGCADKRVFEIAGAGDVDVYETGAAITGESHFVKAGDKAVTQFLIDVDVDPVVTNADASVTYVKDTDYVVDVFGIEVVAGSQLETDILAETDEIMEILIDYTYTAQEVLKALAGTGSSYYVYIEGVNTTNGQEMEWVFPNVRFSPSASISIFQEEFSSFEIEGEILNDPCSDDNAKYYMKRKRV